MNIFVVHRLKDRSKAKKTLRLLSKSLSIELKPCFLNSYDDTQWKEKALAAIGKAEVVILFNSASCRESSNTTWEIDKATESNKEIIEINSDSDNIESKIRLKSLYDFNDEFEGCFSQGDADTLELYKLMIESSESLIQRRQKANAFFITAIGSLLAVAGLLIKIGTIDGDSFKILYVFSAVGLLLCNSWRNLIENYGKLNKAKFDVILRLEKELGAQIYSAEWISLGKGKRPRKYKSFTSTEKSVPIYFIALIVLLTLAGIMWQLIASCPEGYQLMVKWTTYTLH